MIAPIIRYLARFRSPRKASRGADSEQQYRLIADNLADVVFHERDGKIVWVSPSVEDVLGAPPEYWIGRASRDAVPPQDRWAAAGRLSKVTAGEPVRDRLRVISVDGVTHWADTRGRPFYDAAGRPDGFIVSLHLVDDEVAAEQALASTQFQLRASTDSMLDPQVLLEAVRDPDGRVVDLAYRSVNRAACLFLGREEHELVTLSQLESLSNLEVSGLWEGFVECLAVGKPLILDDFPFYSELLGDERRVDFRATKAGPDLISLTWRDVTERSEATQRLADSERNYRLLA